MCEEHRVFECNARALGERVNEDRRRRALYLERFTFDDEGRACWLGTIPRISLLVQPSSG